MPLAAEAPTVDDLLDAFCDLRHERFAPAEFRVKWATEPWEQREAYALRRAVFCIEQGIFPGDDRDATDDRAQLIVAAVCVAGMPEQVVGTVRIHRASEDGPADVWMGSRLAVHPAFRRYSRLGVSLIRLAVGSAHGLGCRTFRAHVQAQNAALFRSLHWRDLGEEALFGRPHVKMEADLAHYPPIHDPERGFATFSRRDR